MLSTYVVLSISYVEVMYFHHTDTYVMHTPGRSGVCLSYSVRNDGLATIPIYLDYKTNRTSIYTISLVILTKRNAVAALRNSVRHHDAAWSAESSY